MDPFLYKPIYLHLVVLLSFYQAFWISKGSLSSGYYDRRWIVVITILLALWLGLRPVSIAFIDTVTYAAAFDMESNLWEEGDWLFQAIMTWFKGQGFSVHFFFLFLELVYIGSAAFICTKLFKKQPMAAFVAIIASFSFYNYAINILRQGVACAVLLLVFGLIKDRKWLMAMLSAYLATGLHKSTWLVLVAITLAHWYRNTRVYFYAWAGCVMLSIIADELMGTIFQSLSLLETGRNSEYLDNTYADMSMFSTIGFRYDFLLYSMVPIIVGAYHIHKGYKESIYRLILNVYIITNSFWVLVNRSWLSNRIAYLSWFLYAIILVYPYLNPQGTQSRTKPLSLILIGNALFSYLMWIIGK